VQMTTVMMISIQVNRLHTCTHKVHTVHTHIYTYLSEVVVVVRVVHGVVLGPHDRLEVSPLRECDVM